MTRLPHPIVLLLACIALAAGLSWILPAGSYERRDDPVTGRSVVVPGTYRQVEAAPVGPFQALVAVPKGLTEAASVVFLVLLVGGAFTVVDRTGALRAGVDWLAARLHDRGALLVPIVCLAFAAGGALQGMQEEIIALVPVLLVLVRRFGYDPLVAAAISLGAANVGAAFSPLNPFGVGIAQKLAELPLLSGAGFRVVVLAIALAIWIAAVLRYAAATRTIPTPVTGTAERPIGGLPALVDETQPSRGRTAIILLLVLAAFVGYVAGVILLGWEFDQMSAVFLLMGVLAGLVGGLGVGGTANAYMEGFREMAGAAILIGVARAIFVVLDQGRIIDTIVHGLVTPLQPLPTTAAALGMLGVQAAIHVPVPSTSGQAVLTLPVLVPLSDLIGLSRQVTVLAYQYGAGLCELLTPTNGAVMAVLAAAGVPYGKWLKFAVPMFLVLMLLAALAIGVAVAIGLR